MYHFVFKRILDIILASIGIVILAIPMLFIAILIKLDSPGPVLFKQKRIGFHKKTFNLWKFRSMPIDVPSDVPTHLMNLSETSMSYFQRAIRKYSIDELPQLFNILSGEMSIVGPRPALWNQYDLIEERDRYGANDVKPGLTGWAQINGRDELEIPIKAKLDGDYVKALQKGVYDGFLMDIKCFFKTFISIVTHDGVKE